MVVSNLNSIRSEGDFEGAAKDNARTLYPHQVEGVAFLLGRCRSLLADDMGLGKTRQSIVSMTVAESEGPYLVICSASVKLQLDSRDRDGSA